MSWSERGGLGESVGRLFAELDENLLAYQPSNGKWFVFPSPDAPKDWAECLFCNSADYLTAESAVPTFFLLLESNCGGTVQRSPLVLLEFLRYLRLSKYHPRARGGYGLWRSPVVCYSFETRERILQRKPEGLVLFSPSVSFKQLPLLASPSWLDDARNVKAATDSELTRYVNSTQPVNLSSHHHLGDMIGPYSILQAAGANHSPGHVSPGRFNAKVLHEILWQMEQERIPGVERDHRSSAGKVDELRNDVQASVARSLRGPRHAAKGLSPTSVVIIDDQTDLWQPVWRSILGPCGWKRLLPETMFGLMEPGGNAAERERFFSSLRQFVRLIILDLRLTPLDQNKELRDISGYRTLRFIRTYDEAIPVLMFTSSHRGDYLHELESAGADAVCIKPTRFDNARLALESLLERLSVLLRPEYHFLQDAYYVLKEQVAKSKPDDNKLPLYWGLCAWQEARQSVGLWIKHPRTTSARLSALSVTRTAGLASEYALSVTKTAGLASEISRGTINRASKPYIFAMNELRNAASHFGSAQAVDTAVGYVAVGLITKMLSVPDDPDVTTTGNRIWINSLNEDDLKAHLAVPRMDPTLKKMLWGAVRVSALAFSLRQNAPALGLDTSFPSFVSAVEASANQWIGEFLRQHDLPKQILDPLAAAKAGLLEWLNSL